MNDVNAFLNNLGLPGATLISAHSHEEDGYWKREIAPNHYIIFVAGLYCGYASVRDGNVSFVEVTQIRILTPEKKQAQLESNPPEGYEYINKVEIDYAESGPISLILAPNTLSQARLGIYKYEDLPEHFKKIVTPGIPYYFKHVPINVRYSNLYYVIDEDWQKQGRDRSIKTLSDREIVPIGTNNPRRFILKFGISGKHVQIQRNGNKITIVNWSLTSKTAIKTKINEKAELDDWKTLTKKIVTGIMIMTVLLTGFALRTSGAELIIGEGLSSLYIPTSLQNMDSSLIRGEPLNWRQLIVGYPFYNLLMTVGHETGHDGAVNERLSPHVVWKNMFLPLSFNGPSGYNNLEKIDVVDDVFWDAGGLSANKELYDYFVDVLKNGSLTPAQGQFAAINALWNWVGFHTYLLKSFSDAEYMPGHSGDVHDFVEDSGESLEKIKQLAAYDIVSNLPTIEQLLITAFTGQNTLKQSKGGLILGFNYYLDRWELELSGQVDSFSDLVNISTPLKGYKALWNDIKSGAKKLFDKLLAPLIDETGAIIFGPKDTNDFTNDTPVVEPQNKILDISEDRIL